ncbi:MAG: NTP/NDP exchange transporter [Gemmatimonadota bacterium]
MPDILGRLLNFRRGELSLASLSAGFFFLILCGYFFLRPVREAMGVSRGMGDLRWLFVLTSVISLVVVLAFGGVVSRTDRRRFIPIGYLFVIVCLIGFSSLLIWDAMAGGGVIGTDAETDLARVVGFTFYSWLSVINLFSTSIFWAYMVDIFNVDQGKRLFAFIGIGGTLGAIVGGSTTNWVANRTASPFLPAGLMLAGAALFALAIVVMLALDRVALRSDQSQLAATRARGADRDREAAPDGSGEKIGGGAIDGLTAIVRSPYLIGIGLYIIAMAISNTLIYFTQANIVLQSSDAFSEMIGRFAYFDMLAQIATLITQIFITTRLIARLGIGWTLAVLPLVTMAGFGVLAVWPTFGVMALFQALQRATRYAISRPARETLFAVVPADEKYKAKPIIDVFLYRGGDVAGAGIDGLLRSLGLSLSWMAMAIVPFAAAWTALSLGMGVAQAKRDPGSGGEEAAEPSS